MITPNGLTNVPRGSKRTFIADADNNCWFKSIKVNGIEIAANKEYY